MFMIFLVLLLQSGHFYEFQGFFVVVKKGYISWKGIQNVHSRQWSCMRHDHLITLGVVPQEEGKVRNRELNQHCKWNGLPNGA